LDKRSRPSGGIVAVVCLLLVAVVSCPVVGDDLSPNESPTPIIDSVEVRAENVFDLNQPQYDNFLFRLANHLHVVTQPAVVRRELLLGKGDRYDTALVNESIRNLRQLPFLLKTDIFLEKGAGGENILVVNTSDKWTTVGGFSLHRTGGRNDLQIGIEENNLLGYGISLANDYFVLEDDRNYYQTEWSDNRFLGKKLALDLFYSDNPRAGITSILFGRPYYNLRQKWGVEILYSTLRRRLDYYLAEDLAAQERSLRTRFYVKTSYRIGPDNIKYYFVPTYQYVDLNPLSLKIYDPSAAPQLPPPTEDSVVHSIHFMFRVEQINYAVYDRLNRFHKSEDVNLGFDARISYGRNSSNDFNGVLYHYFSYWPQYTLAFRSLLVVMGIYHQEWFDDGRRLRRDLNCYLKGYCQYHPNHTLAVGTQYISNRLENRSFTLYLDEDHGLRGYPAFIFNGEDRLVINMEDRIFTDLEILSVGIGGVVFADIGNIWSRNSAPSWRETKAAVGAGFRFGISRSTKGEVVRIDFAYAPERGRWQISIGTGQFF